MVEAHGLASSAQTDRCVSWSRYRGRMIHPIRKAEIINDYRTHDSDTGSPEVQVALLSHRITELTDHFKTHKKDHHSRRGLFKLISQRRRQLNYLKGVDFDRYKTLIGRLGLRK